MPQASLSHLDILLVHLMIRFCLVCQHLRKFIRIIGLCYTLTPITCSYIFMYQQTQRFQTCCGYLTLSSSARIPGSDFKLRNLPDPVVDAEVARSGGPCASCVCVPNARVLHLQWLRTVHENEYVANNFLIRNMLKSVCFTGKSMPPGGTEMAASINTCPNQWLRRRETTEVVRFLILIVWKVKAGYQCQSLLVILTSSGFRGVQKIF